MNFWISIVAAVTVAVTARMVHLLFLSGRKITTASLFGRFVARTEQARVDFVMGWREQSWRYRLIAYPCILATAGLVTLQLYWMLPPLDKFDTFGDVVRYCILLFSVGVSSSLVTAFLLIFLMYFLLSVLHAWWNRKRGEDPAAEPSTTEPAPDIE